MEWFRWYVGCATDPKFRVVARKSGQSVAVVLAVWAMLLERACAAEDRGTVAGLDCEAVDAALDLEYGAAQAVMRGLEAKGLLTEGRVARWEKRQPARERHDPSTERVRAFRLRQRQEQAENTQSRSDRDNGPEGNPVTGGKVGNPSDPKSGAAACADVTECNATKHPETPCNAAQRHETPRSDKRRKEERREDPSTKGTSEEGREAPSAQEASGEGIKKEAPTQGIAGEESRVPAPEPVQGEDFSKDSSRTSFLKDSPGTSFSGNTPNTARVHTPPNTRREGSLSDSPGIEFLELRAFYDARARSEAPLAGYAEYKQCRAARIWPGQTVIYEAISALSEADAGWKRGFAPGLARFLREHQWEKKPVPQAVTQTTARIAADWNNKEDAALVANSAAARRILSRRANKGGLP